MKNFFLLTAVIFFISGCATSTGSLTSSLKSSLASIKNGTPAKDANASKRVKEHYTTKDYQELYKELDKPKFLKSKDLTWSYHAGTVSYMVKDYNKSLYYFNRAEKEIKKYDDKILAGKIASNVASMLTNDRFTAYTPKIYEKIMVNTWKGIDHMLRGDKRLARKEFNRARVRQLRAKAFFAKEIRKEKKELQKEQKATKKKQKSKKTLFNYNKVLKDKRVLDPIEKEYSNLFAFKPYRDFVNPFSNYIAGIYFMNAGDYRKATGLLKSCYGMIKGIDQGSRYVLQDLKTARARKRSLRARRRKYTWVVFFNGLGPQKVEKKIDIPLYLVSKNVFYTGIALPYLKMRERAYDYLVVYNKRNRPVRTKRIASMDRIVKAEFKKRFDGIVLRALQRAVVQTIIQKQLHDRLGLLGGIAAAIYQAGMNRADLRSWDMLPKEFQVARIRSGRKIIIKTPQKTEIANITTDPKKNYIIFVHIPTSKSEPVITYKAFK